MMMPRATKMRSSLSGGCGELGSKNKIQKNKAKTKGCGGARTVCGVRCGGWRGIRCGVVCVGGGVQGGQCCVDGAGRGGWQCVESTLLRVLGACLALGQLAILGLGAWVGSAIGGWQGRTAGSRALGEVGVSVVLMVWVGGCNEWAQPGDWVHSETQGCWQHDVVAAWPCSPDGGCGCTDGGGTRCMGGMAEG